MAKKKKSPPKNDEEGSASWFGHMCDEAMRKLEGQSPRCAVWKAMESEPRELDNCDHNC